MFGNRVPRRIFGDKRDEAIGDCRKLYSIVVFFTKYYYGNQIKKTEIGGLCSTHGGDEKCLKNFGFEA
jgi:hypothetical protein